MGLPLFPAALGRRPDIRFDRCMGPQGGLMIMRCSVVHKITRSLS
jgi:hypothetical protein